MMKHSFALLVAMTTSLLAGCELYFGNGHDGSGDNWNYCGSDGYYICSGETCEWQGPTCPAGAGSGSGSPGSGGSSGSGFECQQNTDCAAGCYCANGTCEEAGFCTKDSDCGEGYVCDEMRSSCEPGTPVTTCSSDANCPSGQDCENGVCTSTCVCATDQQAAAAGFDYCDELRGTCKNGSDPAGTCQGEPTCNLVPPQCQPGDVPLLGADGCWTGECELAGQCADPAPCKRLNTAQDCLDRSADCSPVYTGLNCQKPDGTACNDGDVNCTCSQFVYNSCVSKTATTRTIVLENGLKVNAAPLMLRN